MIKRVRVGLLGCGTLGTEFARVLERKFKDACIVTCLNDIDLDQAEKLRKKIKSKPAIVTLKTMIQKCDFLIEAAAPPVVGDLLKQALPKNRGVLVMSVGGILTSPGIQALLKQKRGLIFLPSGAIAGIDGLLAARVGKIKSVSLVTKKPPKAFKGAPYFVERGKDPMSIRRDTKIFEGTVRQAVKLFPQNINVAATLALAGIGALKTKVSIYACPGLKRNTHQLEVLGDFGRMVTVTENDPFVKNPKTSRLASYSPIALLDKVFGTLKIGT